MHCNVIGVFVIVIDTLLYANRLSPPLNVFDQSESRIISSASGLVGLAISYALGITGKLSGLVSSFTETEKELVAVERCIQVRPKILYTRWEISHFLRT